MRLSFSYDSLGIVSSSLCMIHCIGTPFIFIAKACSASCCADAPVWWKMLDYIFLVICFFAIYYTTKDKPFGWMKFSFWTCWIILVLTLINHVINIIPISSTFIYWPSSIIIILHFYNLKFCRFDEQCCNAT